MTGRPLTYNSPEDLQKAITEYLKSKGIVMRADGTQMKIFA